MKEIPCHPSQKLVHWQGYRHPVLDLYEITGRLKHPLASSTAVSYESLDKQVWLAAQAVLL